MVGSHKKQCGNCAFWKEKEFGVFDDGVCEYEIAIPACVPLPPRAPTLRTEGAECPTYIRKPLHIVGL